MSYTIMIIDDEQMILDMLRDQFEMEQYQVITAKSGEEALQKLTQQPYYFAGYQYARDGWPCVVPGNPRSCNLPHPILNRPD